MIAHYHYALTKISHAAFSDRVIYYYIKRLLNICHNTSWYSLQFQILSLYYIASKYHALGRSHKFLGVRCILIYGAGFTAFLNASLSPALSPGAIQIVSLYAISALRVLMSRFIPWGFFVCCNVRQYSISHACIFTGGELLGWRIAPCQL